MIVDPEEGDLEELGNPIDYFNIYKQKMKELARSKFDRDKDLQFFNYLDRLVEPEKFLNEEGNKLNGLLLLSQFVTDHASLTYVRKRNQQVKRWEEARKQRVEAGLPADPPQADKAVLDQILLQLKSQATVMPLKQKSFHPDLAQADAKQGAEKNYIVRKRFGSNRHHRPPWKDPNPVKYGGPHGMQRLKEMVDTGFQKQRGAHLVRAAAERKAGLTKEEREQEELRDEEARLLAE